MFIFSFDYTKCYQKYSELALSLGFIEVGMLANNIHLLANELGYGTCDLGGFDKIKWEEFIGNDGINKHVVYSLILGKKECQQDT